MAEFRKHGKTLGRVKSSTDEARGLWSQKLTASRGEKGTHSVEKKTLNEGKE